MPTGRVRPSLRAHARYMANFQRFTQCYLWFLISHFASLLRRAWFRCLSLHPSLRGVRIYLEQVPASTRPNDGLRQGVSQLD